MLISQVPYEFTDKTVAVRCLNDNLDSVPYGGSGFVNECGNGSYYVIVLRGKKGEHVGFLDFV
jgi:hypothetical protein